jgi:rhodanese-related sulfurtransferase
MLLTPLSPPEAQARIKSGAVLVDIREADEHARESIPGARSHPLSQLRQNPPRGSEPMIFHCRSGNRTQVNAAQLEAAANGPAFILEGGIGAWKRAGLPVNQDKSQPMEIMRQVQITAGSLVLLGVVLGSIVNPGFYFLSGFVGAGLTFAGISGSCMMARVLALAPWNRRGGAIATV